MMPYIYPFPWGIGPLSMTLGNCTGGKRQVWQMMPTSEKEMSTKPTVSSCSLPSEQRPAWGCNFSPSVGMKLCRSGVIMIIISRVCSSNHLVAFSLGILRQSSQPWRSSPGILHGTQQLAMSDSQTSTDLQQQTNGSFQHSTPNVCVWLCLY